ncbi:hypothetical protein L6R53_27565 [Myxococcota bacterium]|nr:hypothetical protein [Myxococcota bacterium]
MGSAKEQMLHEEAATAVGEEICVRAGVLSPCPQHNEMLLSTGSDLVSAYKLASALVRDRDPLVRGFSHREVTDGVKAAIEGNPAEECTHPSHYD